MQDYFERIGLSGPSDLEHLQRAHLQHIPFENLSVLAGQPVRLDRQSLWAKLVTQRRGGYCFEQNGLFEIVLKELGYPVVPLAARVRRGVSGVTAHTHKLLRVTNQGEEFLVDVGFGGEGPSAPLPWREGAWELQPGVVHRLMREGELWVLQCQHDGGQWLDFYATDSRPHYPADYEMYNYFTSTHPSSLFVNSMLVSLQGPEGYRILFDGLLRRRESGQTHLHRFQSPSEVLACLKADFGLEPPAGMRCPMQPAAQG